MRSTYQQIYSPTRPAGSNSIIAEQNNNSSQINHFAKSPSNKPSNMQYQHNIKNLHHLDNKIGNNLHSYPQAQDSSGYGQKKISGSIKNLEEKIQNMQSMMKQNQSNNQNIMNKNYTSRIGDSNFRPGTDNPGIKREESEPDLRTSCPNIFRKFEQNNSLRNTTHTNLTKFGAIMAEIKKHDEQQERMMKKNGVKHYEPMTPSAKSSKRQSSGLQKQKVNFKSLNDVWNNKVRNNIMSHSVGHKLNLSSINNKNIINGFQISKQLGKGKFGEVNLARHVQTNFVVALKKIIKAKIVQYKMVEQFKRQIRLHSTLDHPNIVKFYGFFQDGQNVYLILQYINGGTLFDYLGQKERLQPRQAVQYLRDTIEAVTYMHERSIAHRDIKPQNIVLTGEKVAKLCDFGWSALVQSSRTTYCGTFDYAPPEILERKNYDTAVDIWCIGVLTYEMLTGQVPFEGEKRKQIMQKIISVDKNRINYAVELPQQARSFIEMLVQKDPVSRPKCKDLLKHPFFAKYLKTHTKK